MYPESATEAEYHVSRLCATSTSLKGNKGELRQAENKRHEIIRQVAQDTTTDFLDTEYGARLVSGAVGDDFSTMQHSRVVMLFSTTFRTIAMIVFLVRAGSCLRPAHVV